MVETKINSLGEIVRSAFDPRAQYQLVSLDSKPYLFIKDRIRYDSIPKDFFIYELGNQGNLDGKPRIAAPYFLGYEKRRDALSEYEGIIAEDDFTRRRKAKLMKEMQNNPNPSAIKKDGELIGTIIGRHALPIGTDHRYHITIAEDIEPSEEEQELDYFLDQMSTKLARQISRAYSAEYEKKDEFFYLGEKADLKTYIEHYAKYMLQAERNEEFFFEQITSPSQVDFYTDMPFPVGYFYFLGPHVEYHVECLKDWTPREIKESLKKGAEICFISGGSPYGYSRREAKQLFKEYMEEQEWKNSVLQHIKEEYPEMDEKDEEIDN